MSEDGNSLSLTDARPSGGDLVDRLLESNLRGRLFQSGDIPSLGRLQLSRTLGSGAMGSVLLARDPVLERDVAIKMLRSDSAPQDLLREARALAQLVHPNIVAIHDVLQEDGSLYLIMEQIAGEPLRSWCHSTKGWREVVAVGVQIADGLAAAHAQGIVHSDIKPENILLCKNRAVLIDFGLAQQEGHGSGGTPAYLPPERREGGGPSAAADQYALFASLFECIEGRRPDGAESPTRVPKWLSNVFKRGLAADPARRYASMSEARDALQQPSRRPIAAAALIVVAAAASTVVWYAARNQDADPCETDFFVRMGLDPRIVDALAERGDNTAHLARRLSEYAGSFARTRRQLCRESGADSATFVAQDACLTTQALPLARLFSRSADWTAQDHSHLVAELAELESPDECRSYGPQDRSDELKERLAEEEERLAEISALFARGRYRAAAELAEELEERTSDLDDAEFIARRDLIVGRIYSRVGYGDRAETVLERGMQRAPAPLLEKLWLARVRHMMLHGNTELALQAIESHDGPLGPRVLEVKGEALRHLRRFAEARRTLRAVDPTQLSTIGRALHHLNDGSVSLELDETDAAIESFDRALQEARTALGDGQPGIGLYLDKLGQGLSAAGRHREAIDRLREAVQLRERGYGSEDDATWSSKLHLARALFAANRTAEARELTALVLDRGARLPPRRRAAALSLRAELDLAHGKPELAAKAIEELAQLADASTGDTLLVHLLQLRLALAGDDRDALHSVVADVSILENTLSLRQIELAAARVEALRRLGRDEEADEQRQILERACCRGPRSREVLRRLR